MLSCTPGLCAPLSDINSFRKHSLNVYAYIHIQMLIMSIYLQVVIRIIEAQ